MNWMHERNGRRTDLKGEGFIGVKFDEKDGLLVVDAHVLALSVPVGSISKSTTTRTIKGLSERARRGKARLTYNRPDAKLDNKSGILFLSTQISGERM
jgi:hypothetical protein